MLQDVKSRVNGVVAITVLVAVMSAVPAVAQVSIYSETFDAGLGTTTANNGPGTLQNEWYFESGCPENGLGGHSAPGAARWGNPASCTDYGTSGTADADLLTTATIDISNCDPGTLAFSVNYLLGFNQSNSYDDARIEYTVDGATTLVADNGDVLGNLIDNPQAWQVFSSPLPDGATLELVFTGETADSLFNSGPGFYIDDIDVTCVTVVPTVDRRGLILLAMLLAMVAMIALRLRRRGET